MKHPREIRTALPLLFLSLLAIGAWAAPELGSPAALWNTIPIVGWNGIPPGFATPERYRQMADAGFTMCVTPDGRPASARIQLKAAANTGIKLIVIDNRMLTDPAAVAAEFHDAPALGMYFLRDEPGTSDFPLLAKARDVLAKADPSHLSYVNLLPNHATPRQLGASDYASYLKQYLESLQPPFFGYDNYGIDKGRNGNTLSVYYFANLESVSRLAREKGLPFWAFAATTSFGVHTLPTEGELRFQVFANLAYGARGIEYFTYWTPPSTPGVITFSDGPILLDGTVTPLLGVLTKVNRDIRALSPALVRLKSLGVQHFASTDPGVEPFSPGHGISAIRGGRAMLGLFTDEMANSWVLLVNRNFSQPGEVTLTTEDDIAEVSEFSRATENLEKVGTANSAHKKSWRVRLAPGDCCLFRLLKKSPPSPRPA